MRASILLTRIGGKAGKVYGLVYLSKDEMREHGNPRFVRLSGTLASGLSVTFVKSQLDGARAIVDNAYNSVFQIRRDFVGFSVSTASMKPIDLVVEHEVKGSSIRIRPVAKSQFEWRESTAGVYVKKGGPNDPLHVPLGEAATITVRPGALAGYPPHATSPEPAPVQPPAPNPPAHANGGGQIALDLNKLRLAIMTVNEQLAVDAGLIAELRDNKLRVVFEI